MLLALLEQPQVLGGHQSGKRLAVVSDLHPPAIPGSALHYLGKFPTCLGGRYAFHLENNLRLGGAPVNPRARPHGRRPGGLLGGRDHAAGDARPTAAERLGGVAVIVTALVDHQSLASDVGEL